MFVIFIAHVPSDWWALWIPARFGFSDATETFVFCSGMASAIAFAAVFDRAGWLMGTVRVAHRVWQVYWSHIALFLAILTLVLFLSTLVAKNYATALNLGHFLNKTSTTVPGLLSLGYVPNYFDILPMYLVILVLIPVVMGLSRISPWAVAALCVGLWLFANPWMLGFAEIGAKPGPGRETYAGLGLTFTTDLPAEPWSNRAWFFNPFAWQLVFFTGFAFMRGWIPAPPVSKRLIIVAAIIVVVSVPLSYFRILDAVPELRAFHRFSLAEWRDKTDFGLLRYIHFLATAYLAWVAVGPLGSRLRDWGRATIIVDVIRKVGQQSLAVFMMSMFWAQATGFLLDQAGRNHLTMLLFNALGFAVIIATAYGVAWIKGQPWRAKPVAQAADIAGSPLPSSGPPRTVPAE